MAHDSNHMADPYLDIYQPPLTKQINHAPIVLEGGPCWCCPPGQMPQGPMPPEQMMGMMKQMSEMMDRCSSNMMQGGPHDRSDAPATPEKKD
jgi:hypothetical protein